MRVCLDQLKMQSSLPWYVRRPEQDLHEGQVLQQTLWSKGLKLRKKHLCEHLL